MFEQITNLFSNKLPYNLFEQIANLFEQIVISLNKFLISLNKLAYYLFVHIVKRYFFVCPLRGFVVTYIKINLLSLLVRGTPRPYIPPLGASILAPLCLSVPESFSEILFFLLYCLLKVVAKG